MKETVITISDMDCAACAVNLHERLIRIKGIRNVNINYASSQAFISYDEAVISTEQLFRKIELTGYEVQKNTDSPEEREQRKQITMLKRVCVSALLTAPLFWNMSPVVQFILATIIQFGPGLYFYKATYRAVKRKSVSMDALVAVSTSVVYAYSTYCAFTQTTDIQLYFLSEGTLISLILFGKYLQILAEGETTRSLKKLLRLQPQKAVVIDAGIQKEVLIDEIDLHTVVLVRAGEHIPVDGVILEGNLVVDESLMTGESSPVTKNPGDFVTGGTVNRSGTATISTERIGKDAMLQRIIEIVRHAQSSRAPIQDTADKIAAFFIPAVIIIAAGVFLLWDFLLTDYNMGRSLLVTCGVLVVACPCALGLATPTSIMVGTGRAAELGILFRTGTVLEYARKTTTVVFDKTGTLTYGTPSITDIIPFAGTDRTEMMMLASSLERYSTHPAAGAVVHYKYTDADDALPAPAVDVLEIIGKGIKGSIAGHTVLCGSRQCISEFNISTAPLDTVPDIRKEAKTEICIAYDGALRGIIGIADQIRADAVETIRYLEKSGTEVWMLTGDNTITARAVGKKLGITHIMQEVPPEKKAQKIQELQAAGKFVAMVGDGVNDSPALAVSNIGIAMGSGSAIASECAGIVLPGNNLAAIRTAIEMSEAAMKNIKQNLLWALCYNVICIPLAACGIINPSIASAAMSFSSIAVLFHSLRLRHAGEKGNNHGN